MADPILNDPEPDTSPEAIGRVIRNAHELRAEASHRALIVAVATVRRFAKRVGGWARSARPSAAGPDDAPSTAHGRASP